MNRRPSTLLRFLLAASVWGPVVLVSSPTPSSRRAIAAEERAGTLSGRILSIDGKPVEHARVALEQPDLPAVETNSGADGRFRLGPVQPVCHVRWLFIDAETFARERIDDVTVFPKRVNDLGDIVLWRGRRVTGRAVDFDGKPLANVRVLAKSGRYGLCHSSTPIGRWETSTDANGYFVTHPLPLGALYLEAQFPGRQMQTTSTKVVPGALDQRVEPIRLEKDLPLVGIVVDEQGKPIEGVDVSFSIRPEHVVSDKAGRFLIRGYGPEMRFSLDLVKEGYYDDIKGTWFKDLPVDRTTSSVTFTLKKAVPFEGHVVDAETDKPVAIHRVGLCDAVRKPDGKIEITSCRLLTFEQPEPGHFLATLTRRGDFELTVMASGYNNLEVFLPASERSSALTFRLRKEDPNRHLETSNRPLGQAGDKLSPQRLSGTIALKGNPVSDAWIALYPAWTKEEDLMNAAVRRGRGVQRHSFPRARALSKSDGSYELYPNPGRWYVRVDRPDSAPTIVGPIAIAEKEVRRLDISCIDGSTISGLVREVPRDLLPHLWVVAFDRGVFQAEGRVNLDGTFKLAQVPPGEYGLKVGHDGYDDPELPWGPFMHRPDKDKLFDTLATPWKGAVVVNVQPGSNAAGIKLELPRR